MDDRLTALAISRSGENCTDLCMESPIKKKKTKKKKKTIIIFNAPNRVNDSNDFTQISFISRERSRVFVLCWSSVSVY